MDRFDAMTAFARVVETGSFTKAAESLQITKTKLTNMVQQLESRLGVRLLNRTTRQVRVTVDGANYYERAIRVLADLEEAEAELPNADTAPRGRLRVDVPSPLATLLLVPALPAFHAQFPHIQLDMGVSDRFADIIGDGVDCVIRGGELTDQSLKARHLGNLPLGLFAAPAYLQRSGAPSHPLELESTHHRIVGYGRPRAGKPHTYNMRRDTEQISVRTQYTVSIDDGNAYLAAGIAGMGILWLPHYMSEPHVASATLLPVLDGWSVEPMPIYAAFPPTRHVSKKLRVFIDWVSELMAPHTSSPLLSRKKP
jgi:DNA-binding transcriptional LysR family regulator